jgi:Mg2+ and Co2+ transporter CorA
MYNEAADAIGTMHMNLTSLKLNDTLQTIFVFSLWIGVLATIAGFFGMGLTGTPFAGNPMAFWIVMSIATLASGILLLVFKKRRWL